MSFILDALKRSEEESRHASGPDLNAVHAAANGRKNYRRFWPFFLFLVLTANALLLLWLLRPWAPVAHHSPPSGTTQTVRNDAADEATTAASLSASLERPSLQAPPGWDVLPATISFSLPDKKPSQQERRIIPYLHELPGEVRRQIPELSVTLHYYTADAAARLARINGMILREGQAVNPYIVVERITANTIIFRQGDTRFRVGDF